MKKAIKDTALYILTGCLVVLLALVAIIFPMRTERASAYKDKDVEYNLTFICPNAAQAAYWGKAIDGMEAADAALGTTTTVIGGASYDDYKTDVLRAMTETLAAAKKPDAILAFCGIEDSFKYNGKSMADLLKEAKEAGIPVFAIESDATAAGKPYREAYIGSNIENITMNALDYVNKVVKLKSKIGLILSGSEGGNDAVIKSVIYRDADFNNMEIVDVIDTDRLRDTAEQMAEKLITEHPDLDAIYVSDTENVLGVCNYINKHRETLSRIAVVGQGDGEEVIANIKSGTLKATMIQQMQQMGYMGVYCAYNYLRDGYLSKNTYDTGNVLVTRDNVDTYDRPAPAREIRVGYYNDAAGRFQTGKNDSERKTGFGYEYYQQLATIVDWTYTYVYCADVREALEKLRDGYVDIVAGVNDAVAGYYQQSMFISEIPMGTSGMSAVSDKNFVVTDVSIFNELNNAMRVYQLENTKHLLSLYDKYYINITEQTLDADELAWLTEKRELKIGYVDDNLPISDVDKNGNVTGLAKDLIDMLKVYLPAGIEIKPVAYKIVDNSEGGLEYALRNKEIDIVFPVYSDYWLNDDKGFKQTDPIFSDRLMIIFRSDDGVDAIDKITNIASKPRAIGQRMYVQSLFPDRDMIITYYNDNDTALAAVRSGQAGCMLAYSSGLQRYWTGLKNKDGLTTAYLDKTAEFSMAVHKSDTVLVGILNKFVRHTDTAYIIDALSKYSVIEKDTSFGKFVQDNAAVFISIFIGIAAILAIIFVLYWRKNKAFNREQAANRAALQQALADAEKANAAKTVFLSSMSHDIRTPMNAIVGMTSIATKHIDDKERVKGCLEKIELSSNHLLTLINDVLDISKIESGKLTLTPSNFSLRDTVANLVNIVRPQINAKQLKFDVHVQGVQYETIYADEVRVNQIFVNLLSNAVKYTPEGGSISMGLLQEPVLGKNRVKLTFTVKDTGIGMSPEFRKNMYEMFARAEDSRINKITGTGLGLAIVKQMVTMMGGTIDCESELNVGTTFVVKIEVPIGENKPIDHSLPPIPVLIVDDDDIFLETTEELMTNMGALVKTANSGVKALELVKKAHAAGKDFSVAIIDWKMPVLSGLETAKAIREAIGYEMPIILASAYDWEDVEDEARANGADNFISKPLFSSYIYEKLTEVLKLKPDEAVETGTADDRLKGLHVLVAEDNELNWEVIVDLLDMYEITAERAENGKRCVEMISAAEKGKFDFILMDVQMPIMNGRDATREIRKSDIDYVRDIPIIAMTADAFTEDIAACMECGMNGYTSKPVDMDKLCQEVHRVLFGDKNER